MTKSRTSVGRELFGMMGTFTNGSSLQASWNHFFTEQRIDASMDHYPTTAFLLPERLSEMFHFDRQVYLVGSSLQEAVVPLLDSIDADALQEGRVDVIVNRGGVLVGHAFGDLSVPECYAKLRESSEMKHES